MNNTVKKDSKKKILSALMLVLTAMIWGFAFVAQRVGAESVGAFVFNGLRFALGAVSLIPVYLIFEREKFNKEKFKKTLIAALVCGTVLFIASALQQYGIELTKSAGKAGFITGLYTVLVPIIAFIIYKQKNSIGVWIGAVLAVSGLFLLSVNESFTVEFGDVLLLIGAFFWAAHILVIDKFIGGVSPLRFASLQFAVCAALNLIFAIFFDAFDLGAIMTALVPLLYGGLGSVGVAYTLQIIGQKNSDPTTAAIIFSLESVFSAIGGAIILGEEMSARGYIGCVLIFGGIILSQLKFGKKKEKSQCIQK